MKKLKPISTDEYIETALQTFSVSDSAIERLKEDYMPLKILDHTDKKGYEMVRAARIAVKGYRVDVDKRRKELTADALKIQRGINAEAKRITELLEPIEKHLSNQETQYEQQNEFIKREAERIEAERIAEEEAAKQKKINERNNKLFHLGFLHTDTEWRCMFIQKELAIINNTAPSFVNTATDEEFKVFIDQLTIAYHEQEKLNAAEKLEAQRVADEMQKKHQAEQQQIEKERAELITKQKEIEQEKAKLEGIKVNSFARRLEDIGFIYDTPRDTFYSEYSDSVPYHTLQFYSHQEFDDLIESLKKSKEEYETQETKIKTVLEDKKDFVESVVVDSIVHGSEYALNRLTEKMSVEKINEEIWKNPEAHTTIIAHDYKKILTELCETILFHRCESSEEFVKVMLNYAYGIYYGNLGMKKNEA
jgi:hypothetical protein